MLLQERRRQRRLQKKRAPNHRQSVLGFGSEERFQESHQQRGDLMKMADNEIVEGHLVVYYEHGSEQKLMVSRTASVEVAAYHHSSRLGHSCHSCVDVVHVKGEAPHVRSVFEQLNTTPNVDKVSFISAPMKIEDCC